MQALLPTPPPKKRAKESIEELNTKPKKLRKMSPAASTRWCPTPEQVMILEEMYRGGVRTPNAAQIQQITAHLSLYGKIEGKNVFYWFQNHKARDRQKLRKKLLGKQHQQHFMFSHHHPTFPPLDHHFQHHPLQNSFLRPLHFDQPPPTVVPSSLGFFHHQLPPLNSSCFVTHQTRAEDVVPRMTNNNSYTWKMESSDAKCGRENAKPIMTPMITHHDHDDWMMMMGSGDHSIHNHEHDDDDDDDDDYSSRRSLKTLELFPIKDRTSLKDDFSFV